MHHAEKKNDAEDVATNKCNNQTFALAEIK